MSFKILVTGEHDDLETKLPKELPGIGPLEWVMIPVLEFELLRIDPDKWDSILQKPVDWILFTSRRSVTFFSEVLLEQGWDFPVETQVACIGEHTAAAANQDGFSPDFYPTDPGTESFLEEFESLIRNNSQKPSVFIPISQSGRMTIGDRLKQLGCEVFSLPLYKTKPKQRLRVSEGDIIDSSCVVFTSPLSYDAFASHLPLPRNAKIMSIGRYTAGHLASKGFEKTIPVPGGDLSRIGEVLC